MEHCNLGGITVPTFKTSDYAQMRRCRMAHLHGNAVNEMFESGTYGLVGSGFIHAIRPDLTCWPLRWTITVKEEVAQRSIKETSYGRPILALQD
jgi:hypothetical protein